MSEDIRLDKIGQEGYIRMTKEMITVFNPLEKGENARRDRGDEINILMYVLNYLNLSLNEDPSLTNLEIIVTHEQFANMLKNKPLTNDKIVVNDILEVIKKVNAISTLLNLNEEYMEQLFIYSNIKVLDWTPYNATYRIKLNPDFIEYYKQVRLQADDYFKLYLDVMLSLSTRASKIIYAYLSRYDVQMNKNRNGIYATNLTNVNDLKFYLDKKRSKKKYSNEWQYKMTTQNLIRIVEQSIKEINEIIKIKREMYDAFIPIYKVTPDMWYREGTGKTSPITKFRFMLDEEDMEQNKDKFGKLTMDDVFEEFHHNDCAIGVALYEYQAMLNRTQQKVRPITVRKMLAELKDLPTNEAIEAIEDATDNGRVKIVKLT